jgi:hypothetical protein
LRTTSDAGTDLTKIALSNNEFIASRTGGTGNAYAAKFENNPQIIQSLYTMSGNTFISDTFIVGDDYNNAPFEGWTPLFTGSTFIKGSNPASNWAVAGVWGAQAGPGANETFTLQDFTLTNQGASPFVEWEGGKKLSTATVTVQWTYAPTFTANGIPLAAASVTISNSGRIVFTGTTDDTGKVSTVLPQWTQTYPQTSPTTLGLYAVAVSKTGCTTLAYAYSATTTNTTDTRALNCQ